MVALSNVLIIAHLTLLFGLLGVTALLLLVTTTNRLRLRKTLLAWRSGPLFGIPILPSLFLLFIAAGTTYMLTTGGPLSLPILVGYVAAGTFWFTASWIGKTLIVTEYGIVANLNGADGTVAWGQIVDYFELRGDDARDRYVFLYVDRRGMRRRLAVAVPEPRKKRFRQIVYTNLDVRFNFATEQAYGKTPLEK